MGEPARRLEWPPPPARRHLHAVREPLLPELREPVDDLAVVVSIFNRAIRRARTPVIKVRKLDEFTTVIRAAIGTPTVDDTKVTTTEPFGTGSLTGNTFTPTANALLVVAWMTISNSANLGNALTMTDNLGSPLTYTPAVTLNAAGTGTPNGRVWTAPVGASPSAMAVIADAGAGNVFSGGVTVVEVTGYNTSTPTGGTATGTNSGNGALTLTLSAGPAAGDATICFCWSDGSTSGTIGITAGTNFTSLGAIGGPASDGSGGAQYRIGNTGTTTAGIADTQSGTMVMFTGGGCALVVKVASGTTQSTSGDLALTGSFAAADTIAALTSGTLALTSTPATVPNIVAQTSGTLAVVQTPAAADFAAHPSAGDLAVTAATPAADTIGAAASGSLPLTAALASADQLAAATSGSLPVTAAVPGTATYSTGVAGDLALVGTPAVADFAAHPAAGTLDVAAALAAADVIVATTSGDLAIMVAMTGLIGVAVSGDLAVAVTLDGQVALSAAAAGDLALTVGLLGSAARTANVAGLVAIGAVLAATAAAIVNTAGALAVAVGFASEVGFVSGLVDNGAGRWRVPAYQPVNVRIPPFQP